MLQLIDTVELLEPRRNSILQLLRWSSFYMSIEDWHDVCLTLLGKTTQRQICLCEVEVQTVEGLTPSVDTSERYDLWWLIILLHILITPILGLYLLQGKSRGAVLAFGEIIRFRPLVNRLIGLFSLTLHRYFNGVVS